MANSGVRGVAATVIGWVLAIVVLWFLLGAIFATIRIVIRLAAIVIVIGGLLWIYFKLKGGDD